MKDEDSDNDLESEKDNCIVKINYLYNNSFRDLFNFHCYENNIHNFTPHVFFVLFFLFFLFKMLVTTIPLKTNSNDFGGF